MAKKLYKVVIHGTYYVAAESEASAEIYAEDYARDTYDLIERVSPVGQDENEGDDGWDGSCLIYGTKSDMTLEEALRRNRAGEPLE